MSRLVLQYQSWYLKLKILFFSNQTRLKKTLMANSYSFKTEHMQNNKISIFIFFYIANCFYINMETTGIKVLYSFITRIVFIK